VSRILRGCGRPHRAALSDFLTCTASEREVPVSAKTRTDGASDLLRDEPTRCMADDFARYCVEFLRRNGQRSPDCLIP
jgi:hypothetical protein